LALAGILCVSFSAGLAADSYTELLESARATRKSASALVDAVNAGLDARDAARAASVDTAAAKVAVRDSAAVDTSAAPVRKVEKPAPAPVPPKIHPIGKPDIEMVLIKGGKFKMGCPGENEGCIGDERPRHEVKLGNFYIGKYPVTQKQWASVMGINPSHFDGEGWADLPVEQVSWNEVQEFIRRLNVMTGKKYRLPTEAEWEYASRGGVNGKGEKFSGHGFLDDIAWYDYNSGGKSHSVGVKKPNEIGLHDMIGNVWEWVDDWYDKNYYRESHVSNPKGPRRGMERVYRGADFGSSESHCRNSIRNFNKPGYRAINLGFRLARTP